MGNKNAQISTEYLILVGFVIFVLATAAGFAFFYTQNISDRVKLDQIQGFANKLISSSESVFYAGAPSKITLNAYLPSGIESINIENNSIVFNLSTSSGYTMMSFESNVEISGDLSSSEGLKKIVITAQQNGVNIAED
ncbi:MAG: hypothetical protein AABX48_01775 [Nanoarchaeota archaeon]